MRNFDLRHMTSSDADGVAEVDRDIFAIAFERGDVLGWLNVSNQFGTVAEAPRRHTTGWFVVGYCLWVRKKTRIVIDRLGVHPHYRRKGIASALLLKAADRLDNQAPKLVLDVPETNLPACLWLKAMEITGKLRPGMFGDEDGIRFTMDATKLLTPEVLLD